MRSGRPSWCRPRRPRGRRAGGARSQTLDPEVLFAVALTLRAALEARRTADRHARRSCRCSPARADAVSPALDQVALAIEQAVDAEGVRDGASPRLRSLRREQAVARERAGERLRELASSLRAHLQEEFLTERERPAGARGAGRRPQRGAGHRPRRVGLRADAVRRAVRARRAAQPAARARRARSARRSPASSASSRACSARPPPTCEPPSTAIAELDLVAGVRPARTADRRAARSCRTTTSCIVEGRHPLLDRRTAVADRPAARGRAHARRLGRERGRQDRRAEDARPRRRDAPVRHAAARADGTAAGVRRRSSPTSATSSRSRAASRPSRATCARSRAIVAVAGPRTLVLLDEVAAGTDPIEGVGARPGPARGAAGSAAPRRS